MAWVESHQELGEHPKVILLCSILSVRKPCAIGTLHLLWYFTLKYAWRDGDLERFDDVVIAQAVGWEGDPKTLITGLQKAGFLDGKKIHDWLDFVGRLVKDRIKYEKANKVRKKPVRKTNGIRTESVANLTLPNPTLPNQQNQQKEKILAPGGTPPTKPVHVNFVDRFKESYERMTGLPFKQDRHHFVIAAKLIKDHGEEVVIQKTKLLGSLCRDRSVWFTQGGWSDFSIEKLSSMWNAIIPEAREETIQEKETRLREELAEKRRVENERINNIMGRG